MNITDSTFVITGAARGLGSAMASRLAVKGANLALIDIDQESLEACAAQCRTAGAKQVQTYSVNVTSEPDVEALFDRINDDFGGIHGLVNNAGITRDSLLVKFKDGKLVSKMSLQQWQSVIDVNLTAVFLCGREAAARMIQTNTQGCIINISSVSRHGNMGQTNYSASKAGVESMAVVWAKELARYGIRAASIAPGFIGTEVVQSMKPEALDKLKSTLPLGTIGDPDQIASAVEFIFENDYVSGRCIEVDGALRV